MLKFRVFVVEIRMNGKNTTQHNRRNVEEQMYRTLFPYALMSSTIINSNQRLCDYHGTLKYV